MKARLVYWWLSCVTSIVTPLTTAGTRTYRCMSYSDYVSWKLKMPSSNACSRSGVGECSDQRRSKPKILTPLAEQLVQTRLLATIEWSQLEQETYKLDILRHGFDYV